MKDKQTTNIEQRLISIKNNKKRNQDRGITCEKATKKRKEKKKQSLK